jgi:hypothetical protein
MLTRPHKDESGFTLIEMVIASGIIVAVIAVFAMFLASAAGIEQTMNLQRISSRVLGDQVEALNGISFDNLVMASTSGTTTDCMYRDGIRRSTRAVKAGPEKHTVDGLTVAITRTVTWQSSGVIVGTVTDGTNGTFCDEKSEPKKVTLTASWLDGGYTRTASVSTIRSKWAEALPGTPSSHAAGGLIEAGAPHVDSAAGWCYTTDGQNGSTALSENGVLLATLEGSGDAFCGYNMTGLTPGMSYTAVMDVSVPLTGVPVDLQVAGVGRGSQAPADNTWHTLTYTWTETGTSRIVGPAAALSATRGPATQVRVRSLTLYTN